MKPVPLCDNVVAFILRTENAAGKTASTHRSHFPVIVFIK